jgi:hypothetical protein
MIKAEYPTTLSIPIEIEIAMMMMLPATKKMQPGTRLQYHQTIYALEIVVLSCIDRVRACSVQKPST